MQGNINYLRSDLPQRRPRQEDKRGVGGEFGLQNHVAASRFGLDSTEIRVGGGRGDQGRGPRPGGVFGPTEFGASAGLTDRSPGYPLPPSARFGDAQRAAG